MTSMYVLCLLLSALTAMVNSLPAPCCMATKWSAAMTDVAKFAKGKVFSQFYYDSKNMAIAVQNFRLEDGKTGRATPLNRVVTVYPQKIRYNIEADNTCTKQDITETFMPQCIPATADYMGSSYVGTQEAGLKYDGWQFPLGAVNLTLGISSPDCVLIVLGVVGSVTMGPVDLSLFFNQYSEGIINPSAFEIPASC